MHAIIHAMSTERHDGMNRQGTGATRKTIATFFPLRRSLCKQDRFLLRRPRTFEVDTLLAAASVA